MLVIDPYDNVVADCDTLTFDSERIPNAELIALACNNHYSLVNALTRLSDVSTIACNLRRSNFAIRGDVWKELYDATDAARKVIADLEKSEMPPLLVT